MARGRDMLACVVGPDGYAPRERGVTRACEREPKPWMQTIMFPLPSLTTRMISASIAMATPTQDRPCSRIHRRRRVVPGGDILSRR